MPVGRDCMVRNVAETFARMKKVDRQFVMPKFLKKRPYVGCGNSGEVGPHRRARPASCAFSVVLPASGIRAKVFRRLPSAVRIPGAPPERKPDERFRCDMLVGAACWQEERRPARPRDNARQSAAFPSPEN